MRRLVCFGFVFSSLLGCVAVAQTVVHVPLDHPAYDHLEHFRALGYWSGGLEVRPIRAVDVIDAVQEIERRTKERPLSAGDVRRLRALQDVTSSFVRGRGRVARADSVERNLPPSYWSFGGGLQFFGQASKIDSLPDLDRRPRRDFFFFMSFDAELPQGMYTQWRFYQDYSALTPDPGGNDWVDNLPPNLRDTLTDGSSRNDLAVLGYGNRWFNAEIGRRDRHWGVGRRGTLFLSENPFPLDGVSLQLRTRYVVLSSLFAQSLRGDQSGSGSGYVAAHRVEVRPPLPFRIGVYEAVAYGNRGIDLAYTNPVGLFLAMTQDITDRSGTDDKKVIGFDFQADLRPVSVYGEFLVDRVFVLDVGSEGEESPISSFAQLAGMRWANPFGLSGSSLDAEYAHLDPQVYFHKDRDPTRAFLSEGELIGHWLGPNADGLYAAWTSPPLQRAGSLRLFFEHLRYGIIDGKRGTELGFHDLQKKDKAWITGDIGKERIFGLTWERRQWPTGVGRMDTILTAAHVNRSGAFRNDGGWLFEIRLKWDLKWATVM